MRNTVLVGAVVVAVLCAAAAARTPVAARDLEPRRVDLPVRALRLAPTWRIEEGARSLRESFPYLRIALRLDAALPEEVQLTPATLPKLLEPPREDSERRVTSRDAAFEAVRLFVAGPVVPDAAAAARVLAAARTARDAHPELGITVADELPERWEPQAEAVFSPSARHQLLHWDVALTALETNGSARLVRVTAEVLPDGTVTLRSDALVEGPALTWQSASFGAADAATRAAEAEAQRARRAAAHDVLLAYGRALAAPRSVETLWPLARVHRDPAVFEAFLGAPDERSETLQVVRFADDSYARIVLASGEVQAVELVAGPRVSASRRLVDWPAAR